MVDHKQWSIAWARFEAFRENLRAAINEECVGQFHDILTDLEAALGESLAKFKIPDLKLAPKIISVRPMGYSGRGGSASYSKDRYVDSDFFHTQVDGLHSYLKATVEGPIKPYKPPARQSAGSHVLHVENMYGSSIQHGSPGAVANINYRTNDPAIKDLVEKIKTAIDQVPAAAAQKATLYSDVATIEAQLTSPQPKSFIITECLRSSRSIFEGMIGSVIASGIVHEIGKFLGV